ncbi:MAG: dihydroorotate dehydrogenase [Rhodobacteraceae bacterium]|nr:dihydroorotate dehydrogenase [Paracoccaceae bacterium]
MADTSDEFDGLDAFFEAGQAEAPALSDALLARIVADAAAVQAAALQAAKPAPVARRRPGLWHTLSAAIGGRGAVAGLLSATLAGLWLGFSPPAQLAPLTRSISQSVLGDTTTLDGLDLIPAIDTVLTEG